jgi:putative transposase
MKCTVRSGAFHAPYKTRRKTMPQFRRWYVPGGTVFFTVVTHLRRPLFEDDHACKLLGQVLRAIGEEMPFRTVALVLLPDHLHTIWTLPAGDGDFSTHWKKIKHNFTVRWLAAGGREARLTPSQAKRGRRGIWQRRFWEHQVRDEDEMEALCDYIHYNPVKHGYVTSPADWPYSTFRRFVEAGIYLEGWGATEPDSVRRIDVAKCIGEP